MTLQQVAGSEPAIIRGKDFLIVPEWIHNPHSYSMTIGSDELSIGIKTDDGKGLRLSQLYYLNGNVNEKEGMLCVVDDDSVPDIWLDPKRPSVIPDSATAVCVLSSTNNTPKYLLRQDGPLESEFNEAFHSVAWMADKLNVEFSTVTSALNSAYERAKTK